MKSRALISLCVLGAALSEARADTPADATEGGTDQVTLPKGRVVIDAFLEASLADGAVFKPFSISPDIWYGVNDDLTVGLVHSAVGVSGFMGGVGTSLCLSGSDNGCEHVYQNVSIQGRYKLRQTDDLSIAVDGGLLAQDVDPFELALKIGAVGRWHKEKLAVEAQPALIFGLTNRTVDIGFGETITVNGDFFLLPVTGLYSITPQVAVSLQTGLVLPFQATGDTWSLPLSIGAHFLATEKLNLTVAFSLLRLVGGSSGDAFDARTLTIGGSYAL